MDQRLDLTAGRLPDADRIPAQCVRATECTFTHVHCPAGEQQRRRRKHKFPGTQCALELYPDSTLSRTVRVHAAGRSHLDDSDAGERNHFALQWYDLLRMECRR